MPGLERMRLLILGGTGEAAALADETVAAFGARIEVITSLAGRTRAPRVVAGTLRVGGFGGSGGLAEYLARERIDLVVDATHPFAAEISSNAFAACGRAGVPRLTLLRPPWQRQPGDRWIEVDGVAQAVAEVGARARRAFVTVGVRELQHFARLAGVFCLVRLIEAPASPPPLADCTIVTGRGPFTVESERALLGEHGIDCLVSKASGGHATEAKIIAARELALPVIMVRRPAPPEGELVSDVAAARAWISERLAGG